MNQEKIGIFIAESRKKKNLTQVELAEKLGGGIRLSIIASCIRQVRI